MLRDACNTSRPCTEPPRPHETRAPGRLPRSQYCPRHRRWLSVCRTCNTISFLRSFTRSNNGSFTWSGGFVCQGTAQSLCARHPAVLLSAYQMELAEHVPRHLHTQSATISRAIFAARVVGEWLRNSALSQRPFIWTTPRCKQTAWCGLETQTGFKNET